jgi:HEAT repeat protein
MTESTKAESVGQVLNAALAGDVSAASRLVDHLVDPSPQVQAAALNAVQSCSELSLWTRLLALRAEGTWGDARDPLVAPGSLKHHRLALQLYALFVDDPVPATIAAKEEALMVGLRDARPAVRANAAGLLGVRRMRRAVDALLVALQDADAEVRRRAARALGRIGDPAAAPALVGALASPDGVLRQNARAALVALGAAAVPRLVEALACSSDQVRWEAAKALAEISSPAAAAALVRALEDDNGGVRWVAAEGLIALGREGLEPLLRALIERSHSPWLRQGAHHVLRMLARRGYEQVVAPVLAALEGAGPALEAPIAAVQALDALRGTSPPPH